MKTPFVRSYARASRVECVEFRFFFGVSLSLAGSSIRLALSRSSIDCRLGDQYHDDDDDDDDDVTEDDWEHAWGVRDDGDDDDGDGDASDDSRYRERRPLAAKDERFGEFRTSAEDDDGTRCGEARCMRRGEWGDGYGVAEWDGWWGCRTMGGGDVDELGKEVDEDAFVFGVDELWRRRKRW